MKILGFNIKKISIERKNPIKGKLEIKTGLNIEDIEKEEVNFSKDPALKFDFVYKVDYNPDLANLEIKGSVIVLDDSNESKEILKEWKKKKFTNNIKLPLFNFIMDKCSLKAIHLEDELGLPLHIPFPKLSPSSQGEQKKSANYTG